MIMLSRRALLVVAAFALALPARAGMLEALFAPKARLWERWTRYDAASAVRVDHGVWQAFLARYLRAWPDGTARLAYGAVTAADRANLASYVDRLAAVPVGTLARPEQLAFWINLYNALTVKVVLDAYPVRSIRDIALSRGLFAEGPWDAPLVTVDGERVSLDDIEHRIVRPIWRDPRVHYALNCASIGCPNLPSAAFTRATSEALLEAAARAYINHPRGVDVDPRLGGLAVSKIYGWFAEDFGGTEGVIAHLLHYAEPALAARIRATPRLADYRYDWALNDAG